MNGIFSGGAVRATWLVILLIALLGAIAGIVAANFGPEFLPRLGSIALDKIDQLCIKPKGC